MANMGVCEAPKVLSSLTTASSSLARSTVPNSPVGFPKLPKPSTRSPGIGPWSVAEGSASTGFLARSESEAPRSHQPQRNGVPEAVYAEAGKATEVAAHPTL
jgi:hypothetical protein